MEKYGKKDQDVTERESPEFANLMETLNNVDNNIREIAFSDDDGGTFKSLIKVAKSNFNRREYVNAVIYLGRFHDKFIKIKGEFDKLQGDLTAAHQGFLFGKDLDPEQKKFLLERMPEKFKAKPKAPAKKAGLNTDLVKEAGIGDWWHNMSTDRGRALKIWEKRFPKYAKQLRKDTERMINKSEVMMHTLGITLKTLAGLRKNRELEDYIAESGAFLNKFNQYNDLFKEYYNSNIDKIIETQKGIDAAAVAKLEQAAEVSEEIEAEEEEKSKESNKSVPSLNLSEPGPPSSPAIKHIFDPANIGIDEDEMLKELGFPAAKPISNLPDDRLTTAPSGGGGGIPAEFPKPSSKKREVPSLPGFEPTSFETFQPSSGTPSSFETFQPSVAPRQQTVPTPSIPFRATMPAAGPATLPSLDLRNPNIPRQRLPSKSLLDLVEQQTPTSPGSIAPDTEVNPPTLQGLGPVDSGPPDTERTPMTMRSHSAEKFIEELSAASNESPFSLANRIVKFANSIAKEDKAASDKLLVIARNILSRI